VEISYNKDFRMNSELKILYEATDNLINQQFYKGGHDVIIGRTPEVHLKISNSGQIVQKFKDLFNENIDLFLEGNYLKFLLPFKKIKGLDEETIFEINEQLKDKFELLKDDIHESEIVVLYTFVLSALISRIRDLHFNNAIEKIKRRVKEKSSKISGKKIQETLDNLFMRNNDNISILYNISYLDALALSFNYKKVSRVCKIQQGKYMNRIVDLILSAITQS
jgi:hypothetical protein